MPLPALLQPTKVKRGRRWSVVVAFVVLSFLAGRWSSSYRLLPSEPVLDPEGHGDGLGDNFVAFVKVWNDHVASRDGFLPRDPYRGLLDSGRISQFELLRPIHFVQLLPVRLNPQLSQNPHWVIFWIRRNDLRETWNYFADGTWSKLPFGKRLTVQEFSELDLDTWRQAWIDGGFPNIEMNECDAWVAVNRDRVVWDPSRRIYVLRKE